MITPLLQSLNNIGIQQKKINNNTINFTAKPSKFSVDDCKQAEEIYNTCKNYIAELLPEISKKRNYIENLSEIFSKKPGCKPNTNYTTDCIYDNYSKVSYYGNNYTIKKTPDGKKILQIGEKLHDQNIRYYYTFSNKKNKSLQSIHEYKGLTETLNVSLINGKVVSVNAPIHEHIPGKYNIKLDYKGNIKDISTEDFFNNKRFIFDTKGKLLYINKLS